MRSVRALVLLVALTAIACATTSQVRLESAPKERDGAFAIDLVVILPNAPDGIEVADGCRKAPLALVLRNVEVPRDATDEEADTIHVDARFCPDRKGRYVWRARDADEPLALTLSGGTYELDVRDGTGAVVGHAVQIHVKNIERSPPAWPRPWVPPDWSRRNHCVDVGCVVPFCSMHGPVGSPQSGTAHGGLAALAIVGSIVRRRRRSHVVARGCYSAGGRRPW